MSVLPRPLASIAIVANVGACAAAVAACLTAPPPDLLVPPLHRPTILHDAVVPPASGPPLTEWPAENTFVVPVEIDDPNRTFYYNVFDNYDPTTQAGLKQSVAIVPTPSTVNGGIYRVEFTLEPPDPTFCHQIEFLVAYMFDAKSPHTPDSTGGDIVSWWYTGPNGCPTYDAGDLADGAFPADASPL